MDPVSPLDLGMTGGGAGIAEIADIGNNLPRINADDRGSEKPKFELECFGMDPVSPLDLGMERGRVGAQIGDD
jgi:hypothetical protein